MGQSQPGRFATDEKGRPTIGFEVGRPAGTMPRGSEAEQEGQGAENDGSDAGDLKGEALTQALKDRGLPNTGTADEKRAAVAKYDEDQAAEAARVEEANRKAEEERLAAVTAANGGSQQ